MSWELHNSTAELIITWRTKILFRRYYWGVEAFRFVISKSEHLIEGYAESRDLPL